MNSETKTFHNMPDSESDAMVHQGKSEYDKAVFQHSGSHYNDKTVSQPFYLYNGNLYPERLSLYWDTVQIPS